MWIARALLLAAVLAACASPAATPSPEATLDVAAIRASFAAECESPIIVDEMFCEQVNIPELTTDGTILLVPTTLNAAADGRAAVICELVARMHFDGQGVDLGYATVGVRDRDGGNAAACSVDR